MSLLLNAAGRRLLSAMRAAARLALVFAVAGALLGPAQAAAKHRVPDGFVIEPIAAEPDVLFPMFAVFDDRGRLFVAESSGLDLYAELQAQTRKCRIRLLEDPDEKGRFRKSRVFADKLVFPMGLAWRDGKLYVADPPDLVVLEDTDEDGKADQRTVILTGFGHKDNGSLHGLVFGPDGLLYLTMGSPDGYKLKRRDGSVLQGESGALIRCRADGSDPEVLCRGFENLVEVVFTPRGEVLGTDNWFQKPSGGIRDALVHLVEGGLYPRHRDKGTPQTITGEPLPAVSLFPAVALSGLALYRGQAFPAEMRGNLFSAQHNARKVGRHVLIPDGSTFRTQDFDFVTSDDPDFHPSDVLEAADGSLIVVDTGSWYVHHCPTGQIRKVRAPGGLYRVRPVRGMPVEDPYGLKVDWQKTPADRLLALLGDPRPVVQDRAQRTLSSRGKEAVTSLAWLLDHSRDTAARQHAIWALAAIADDSALPPLRKALHDVNADLAAPAARALALRKDRQAAPDLCRLLSAESPHLRLAAAEALAHCGDAKSLPALWQALAGQPDRFREHALIHALHRLADVDALEAALREKHPRVQKAALLLLGQPPRPRERLTHEMVVSRVTADDADLRQTALRLLQDRPEWAEHAVGLVRTWLGKSTLSKEEQVGLRGLILAFQGQRDVQELVGTVTAAGDGKTSAERRLLLLETLAESHLAKLPSSWVKALGQAIEDPTPAIRLQAVRTVAVLQVPQLDDPLSKLAEEKSNTVELRLEALRAVLLRRPKLSAVSFEFLLAQLVEKDKPLTRLAAAEVLGRSQLTEAQLSPLLRAIRGDALISPAVVLPAAPRSLSGDTAAALLDYLAEAVRNGWRPSEQELEKVFKTLPESVQTKTGPVRELLQQSTERQRKRLADFEPLLTGGNPERGRAVFFSKKTACATCHRIGAEGGPIGPDLTKLGTVRSGRDILEAVVVPSSTIAQGYENYLIATKDGRVVSGVLSRQATDMLVLRDSSGAELRLRRDQIQEMTRQATSLMPEGLERTLTTEEFRDLLAFLQSLK